METQVTGKKVDRKTAAKRLMEASSVLIICHRAPDGDTTGSGMALYHGLIAMGKEAQVICSDEFPKIFSYLYGDRAFERPLSGEPSLIVAVDLADTPLFGQDNLAYGEKTDLCIDHHISNSLYAKETLLYPEASSTCEVMSDLLLEMEAPMSPLIASCLYTGLITDTGLFMYSCTGAHTHEVAARLIRDGADYVVINKRLFGTKSRTRLQLEQEVYAHAQFYDDDRIVFVDLALPNLKNPALDPTEADGMVSMLLQIEGVLVSMTLKPQPVPDQYRVSIRTGEGVNAVDIAGVFGGGGHLRAAGCTVKGTPESCRDALVKAAEAAVAKGE